eukprot:2396908-Prymnesium_polylepis.1
MSCLRRRQRHSVGICHRWCSGHRRPPSAWQRARRQEGGDGPWRVKREDFWFSDMSVRRLAAMFQEGNLPPAQLFSNTEKH